jgi:hypothetical protein
MRQSVRHRSRVIHQTIIGIADSVQGGGTFSEALAGHPRIFNKLYINMVKAGELGGVLEIVLLRLAEFQEKAQKTKNKVVSAMFYPVIVLVIAIIIMAFLLVFIVPKFEAIFADITFPAAQTTVVIDPPRKGCTQEFLDQLIAFRPRRVVYVSCDPATQVRDLARLRDAGFTLAAVQPFDLFPHTRHVENIMTFDGPI